MARPVSRLLARSLALCAVLMLALGAASASATTLRFDPVGAERSFVVPAGVTSIHIVAIGARGGSGGKKVGVGGPGGPGDRVEGDIPVTPGQVLFVEVGGVGGSATQVSKGGLGGFNGGADGGDNQALSAIGGGGGGGGASDVRLVSRSAGTASLQSRLLVAGGGGGGGGVGGGAGPPAAGAGGAAGKSGGDSAVTNGFEQGRGGGGATATAPGKGGATNGLAGTLGIGGSAEDLTVASEGTASAGGGGGGAFGGGGGGRNEAKGGSAAGGGGGSSLFGPTVTGASIIREATEDPLVTLTFTAAPGPGPGSGPTPAGAPQTKLRFRPPSLIETSKPQVGVQFRFAADVADSTFKCKIDKKKFNSCSSPKRYRVKPGKHVFKVKAIAGGVPDATPVKFEFRVKRVG